MANVTVRWKDENAQKFFERMAKQTGKIDKGARDYLDTISIFVYQDVLDHFEEQEGGPGKFWTEWADSTLRHYRRIGKAGNRILQDTGHLRNSFKPSNYRRASNGFLWFNNAKTKGGWPYAGMHNEGGKNEHGVDVPARRFMWLSNNAMKSIAAATAFFIMNEGR